MKNAFPQRGQAMALTRDLSRSAGSKRATGRTRSRLDRAFACLRARQEGQSVLEVAIVLPVLMTVMMTIFYIGWSFNNKIMLTQAVGAGAQYIQAIAQNTATTVADPCLLTTGVLLNAAPNLAPASINITYNLNGSQYTINGAATGAECSGASSNFVLGGTVTVSATYPCNFGPLNGLANLFISGNPFSNSCLIQAKSDQLVY
ncbi:MAG: TadE/TadG family type IV pilus assembly protein [Terracidiphilus sp.]